MNSGTMRTNAHAKINLGLKILNRRPDGFHNLTTIFQRISLADIIEIEPIKKDIIYEGPSLTDKLEDNLCYKAAEVFQSVFGTDLGVRIQLMKKIPIGAGLGGGSSDAAAILKGLSTIYGVPADNIELKSRATEIGADVSFFMSNLSSARGEGKGETITAVQGLGINYYILIIKPEYSISTSWAYRQIDNSLTFDDKNIKMFIRYFLKYKGGLPTAQMTNDFEIPVFLAHPELANARNLLLLAGAEFAGLCGSGSALFAIFKDRELTEKVASEWSSPWLSYVCRPC